MESSIRDFVLGIPVVTRFLFLGTLAVTIVGNWGLVNPYLLILTPAVYESLQVRKEAGPGGELGGRGGRGGQESMEGPLGE